MATNTYFFLTFSLFSFLCNFPVILGAKSDNHRLLRVRPLPLPTEACSSKEYKGRGLKIVHRYGPCSPFDGEKATPIQILQQDQSRVNWLQSRLTHNSSRLDVQDTTLPARPGESFHTGNYIVTVGFGTPKKDMTIAFDTGSDLTWIQCQPCAGGCYEQQDPIFNPAESSSYLKLSCNSAECSKLSLPKTCFSSTCVYGSRYGDGSQSIGFFASETLTLSPSDIFPNFQFGCAQQSRGLFGRIAGLLGLGRDPISLVSQTATKFGRVFSYCLPSVPSSTGYLTFGADAIKPGIKFTPLITKSNGPSFYFLNLIGINVGGQAVAIPTSTFESPGTIIDSGTVISRLPSSAYAALRSAFRQAMSKYTPATSPISLFDTCYELGGAEDPGVPKVVLRFEGDVDVNAGYSGTIRQLSETVGCLAFAANDDNGDFTIIGNSQQLTLDVVYDVAGGRLGFGPGDCR
ncbi:aspartyl protease family protein At5g10770-like isoform X2 [Magnolia sinica]|uniref:aspartyl protease family protein At5g10770-like isoform X2 n=1 Tax=Magnolia sinica TaxID=86752 RepID=UPI002659A831|nr:aspartyl protease family protein At5g10770-like isoform X2 [Magnolia sinica]